MMTAVELATVLVESLSVRAEQHAFWLVRTAVHLPFSHEPFSRNPLFSACLAGRLELHHRPPVLEVDNAATTVMLGVRLVVQHLAAGCLSFSPSPFRSFSVPFALLRLNRACLYERKDYIFKRQCLRC